MDSWRRTAGSRPAAPSAASSSWDRLPRPCAGWETRPRRGRQQSGPACRWWRVRTSSRGRTPSAPPPESGSRCSSRPPPAAGAWGCGWCGIRRISPSPSGRRSPKRKRPSETLGCSWSVSWKTPATWRYRCSATIRVPSFTWESATVRSSAGTRSSSRKVRRPRFHPSCGPRWERPPCGWRAAPATGTPGPSSSSLIRKDASTFWK